MAEKHKKHILIIEDSSDLQALLTRLFELEGYIITQAFNGKEALDLLRVMPEKPALILLDIMMPVMDGFEFRKEQKNDPILMDIPVVVMTADSDPQSKAAQMGVEHLFIKPIRNIGKLLELADSFCV